MQNPGTAVDLAGRQNGRPVPAGNEQQVTVTQDPGRKRQAGAPGSSRYRPEQRQVETAERQNGR